MLKLHRASAWRCALWQLTPPVALQKFASLMANNPPASASLGRNPVLSAPTLPMRGRRSQEMPQERDEPKSLNTSRFDTNQSYESYEVAFGRSWRRYCHLRRCWSTLRRAQLTKPHWSGTFPGWQMVILSLEFEVNEKFPVIASIITYLFCQIDSCLLEKSRGGGTR